METSLDNETSSKKKYGFRSNNLMKRKPPMNPYTFTEIQDMEKNPSRDILYDFTRLELPQSSSNFSLHSGNSGHYVDENSASDTQYRNFKPKFTTASKISLSTKTSFKNENLQRENNDKVVRNNGAMDKFLSNQLKIQGDELNNLMQKLENLKKKEDEEEFRRKDNDFLGQFYKLKEKYSENENNYQLMRKLRKVYGKMYTTNADKALAFVKSGRMMDKRDMVYALEKIEEQKKKNRPPGQMPNHPRNNVVVKRRRRRRPSTSSSDESRSPEAREMQLEPKKRLNLMEIEQKAQEIVQRKLAQALPRDNQPANNPRNDMMQSIEENEDKVVKLPNGMTLIKSDNPNDPPMILMPEDKGSSKFSRTISSNFSKKKNMMNEYMDNMMALKMMKMMQDNEDQRSVQKPKKSSLKDKRKKKKKKRRVSFKETFAVTKPPENSEITQGILPFFND